MQLKIRRETSPYNNNNKIVETYPTGQFFLNFKIINIIFINVNQSNP